MTTRILTTASAMALTLSLPLAAAAQTAGVASGQQQTGDAPEVVTLSGWNYDQVYADGWSADEFIDDVDVVGANGEEIGDVENLLLDENGKILSVIAEVGGFLDIGDTHVAVPWNQVEMQGEDAIAIPVTEENVEDYSLYGQWGYVTAEGATEGVQTVDDDLATGPNVWRASELINDYVRARDGVNFGYVDDLVFDDAGELQAVVVARDVASGRGGPYAYPFYGYGYGFAPGAPYYDLPYGEDEAAGLEPFEADRLGRFD